MSRMKEHLAALLFLRRFRAVESMRPGIQRDYDAITALSDRLYEDRENWNAEIADKAERRAAASQQQAEVS